MRRAVVDFVRAVREAHREQVRCCAAANFQDKRTCLASVVAVELAMAHAGEAPWSLDRVVDDLAARERAGDLDHGDLVLGALVADLVHHVGGLEAPSGASSRCRCGRG
jgi:hypothetical protein